VSDRENPTYREQTSYITADKTGQVIPRAGLRRLPLALDVAAVERQVILRGDYLYADSLSTGVITVKLNSTSEDPMPLQAQASVEGFPMKEAFLSWAAQPGLILNLWYGYQGRMRPPQSVVGLAPGTIVAVGSLPATAAGAPQGGDADSANSKAVIVNLFNAGVAAQVSGVAIANPAASGKTLYIDRLYLSSNLATLILADFEVDTFFTDVSAGALKLAPNALSTARAKSQSNKVINADSWTFNLTANESRDLVFTRPFVIPAGRCLALQTTVDQCVLNGFAEGREY
jgi:hypothetical protein